MRIIDGIPVWGDPVDEGAMRQAKRCALTADRVALMADHHLGYAVPIGGVVAYANAISPSGVGYDIACGNKAVRLDIPADHVRAAIGEFMDLIADRISFGVGRKNDTRVDHDLFDDPAWGNEALRELKPSARDQLGTVGGGNHYVDVFADEDDRVWVGVHFGSRGLGHKTATHFLKAGGAKDGIDVDPLVLDATGDLGASYLECMSLAGRYAYAGRDWVCAEVARLLGAEILEEVHNHHNFAWREEHGGREYWVVRKGATPAFPGQRGFVGASMGENAVIVEGVDGGDAEAAMRSTVHGAGRVMSRTAAAGKKKWRKLWQCGQRGCDGSLPTSVNRGSDGSNPKCPKCGSKLHKREFTEQVSEGAVTRAMMDEWVGASGVTLRGGEVDESPHCYKRLPEVLAHHAGSIRIVHTLTPLGVAMAGSDVFDPFKD